MYKVLMPVHSEHGPCRQGAQNPVEITMVMKHRNKSVVGWGKRKVSWVTWE